MAKIIEKQLKDNDAVLIVRPGDMDIAVEILGPHIASAYGKNVDFEAYHFTLDGERLVALKSTDSGFQFNREELDKFDEFMCSGVRHAVILGMHRLHNPDKNLKKVLHYIMSGGAFDEIPRSAKTLEPG